MVTFVDTTDIQEAAEDEGLHLDVDVLRNEKEFDDVELELQCAVDYLTVGGTSWDDITQMTVGHILERYHEFLQQDVLSEDIL